MANIINAITTGAGGLSTTADASGSIQIATNNGTTAMTIDTSQNVGIGTTTPSKLLHAYRNNTGQDAQVQIEQAGSGSPTLGFLETGVYAWLIGQYGSDNSFRIAASGADLNTSPRLVIDTNGFLMGAGNTSSTNFGLNWGGGRTTTAFNCAQIAGLFMGASGSGGGVDYPYVGYGFYTTLTNGSYRYSGSDFAAAIRTGATGRIDTFTAVAGTAGNTITWTQGPFVANLGTSWTSSSDERLKNITGEISDAINKVSQLRAAEFTWKSDESNKPCVGLIAQDVEKVLPEAVVIPKEEVDSKTGEQQYLGVNYTEVIPLLVAAIKEQQTIINDLKARITALEGAK